MRDSSHDPTEGGVFHNTNSWWDTSIIPTDGGVLNNTNRWGSPPQYQQLVGYLQNTNRWGIPPQYQQLVGDLHNTNRWGSPPQYQQLGESSLIPTDGGVLHNTNRWGSLPQYQQLVGIMPQSMSSHGSQAPCEQEYYKERKKKTDQTHCKWLHLNNQKYSSNNMILFLTYGFI